MFDDCDQLVADAQRRDVSRWAERDEVHASLLERATYDAPLRPSSDATRSREN
jgi:hypothetical protein